MSSCSQRTYPYLMSEKVGGDSGMLPAAVLLKTYDCVDSVSIASRYIKIKPWILSLHSGGKGQIQVRKQTKTNPSGSKHTHTHHHYWTDIAHNGSIVFLRNSCTLTKRNNNASHSITDPAEPFGLACRLVFTCAKQVRIRLLQHDSFGWPFFSLHFSVKTICLLFVLLLSQTCHTLRNNGVIHWKVITVSLIERLLFDCNES